MAHIRSIVYQPEGMDYAAGRTDFIRVPVDSATLVAGHGIQGDQKAGHHPRRQVNLLTDDWLAARRAQGYKTGPGDFGEQLILSGLAFESLRAGDKLHLGDEAVLELTGGRSGCSRLEAAQGRELLPEFQPAIGMLARVIEGGAIQVGDPVVVRKVEAQTA